ncbi:MAG: hypothetical protein DWB42_17495 [Chloroflexi bacterium]|nr:hypothetical protein [Chloroflexota bacterium]MDL1883737.1 hypothetical protein [Anaerolineae bacterium CFX8]
MHNRIRLAAALAVLLLMLLSAGAALAQDATAPAQDINSGLIVGLRHLHSFVRWLVVIVTVAAVVKLGLGLAQNAAYDTLTQRLMSAFSGLTSLQWLVGLVFLAVYGGTVGFGLRHFWEHAAVMTVAVALSHMPRRFKDAEPRIRYRNSLIIVVVVLALVIVGVALLPQGWRLLPPAA